MNIYKNGVIVFILNLFSYAGVESMSDFLSNIGKCYMIFTEVLQEIAGTYFFLQLLITQLNLFVIEIYSPNINAG